MEPTKTKKGWLSLETSIAEDFAEHWGREWGCDSEVGQLRAELLRRPFGLKGQLEMTADGDTPINNFY